MDFNDLAVFRMAKTKMDWVAQRQKVLAQNIANADTPNYRAHDLKQLDFKRMAMDAIENPVTQTVTNPGHVKAALPETGPFREFHDRHTWESSIDDNPVVVEEQVEKIARSKSQYEMALRLIGKNISMLRTALGRSGSG